MTAGKLFKSFLMAGFEGATHINRAGERLDMIVGSQHDTQVDGDYERLSDLGIKTIRDGARWNLIDKGNGVYDFSSLEPMVEAAEKHGMQVIWTLCHYGWPDGVDVFSDEFVDRFAKYCGAVAHYISERTSGTHFYTPVNEISFCSGSAGEWGDFYPHEHGRGAELKKQLVRAAIAGINAIRAVDPDARMVHVDPLVHIIAPRDRPELAADAAKAQDEQFEAFQMLAGNLNPELGGSPAHLDIVGLNFYAGNEWEHFGERLAWHEKPRDARWTPLHELVEDVARRFPGHPIILSETSHVGVGRAEWMHEITDEIAKIDPDVDFEGVCLYPIVDRYDWNDRNHWHNSGLWDFRQEPDGTYTRVINEPYEAEIQRAKKVFDGPNLT